MSLDTASRPGKNGTDELVPSRHQTEFETPAPARAVLFGRALGTYARIGSRSVERPAHK